MTIKTDEPVQPSSYGHAYAAPSAPPLNEDTPIVTAAYVNEPIVATVVDDSQYQNSYVPPKHDVPPKPAPPRPAPTTSCPPGELSGLGLKKVEMQCPFCDQVMKTRITAEPDQCTLIAAIVIFCLFWPLAWIPFVCDCCKRSVHYCTKCHRKVGYQAACSN